MKRFAVSVCWVLLLSCSASDGTAGSSPALPLVWEVTGLRAPESAYFDAGSGFLFVSQVGDGGPTGKDGDGAIAKLTLDGKVIEAGWITGLNAPKGLRSSGGTLWVSDIDRIVGIDIAKGEISDTIAVPGAKFLNDVACGPDGTVYVSDMTGNKIYRYRAGEVSVLVEGALLENPNGLLVVGDRLIVAGWGAGRQRGRLFALDLQTRAKKLITSRPVGNLDGVESDGKGGYLVTDWLAGSLFRIGPDGSARLLADLPQGTADLAYLPEKRLVIVPRMSEGKVSAFELRSE